ncbi:class I SAM-dependent methyltransferase [Phycicoccus sp. CSK15P-2]|uniref:class I SAM-dependent methyltransferase n=1 Tax=Phycicoccus sp. CSK15P-2 TaxID=2807627 RepID=UPI00194E2558|nr:class I SAM-dependent methyltransferase [Phycicoccus sp. CSK15P-2]MBM6405799.1 class I SAM-dependent methyltransferase [Phycicoccus sp. CSK15P-2]
MDFATIDKALAGTRFMTTGQAKVMYDFVLRKRLSRVLELGFAHGKSSCYLAAAVEEVDPKNGHVLTIDRTDAERRDPNIWELGRRTGMGDRITPVMAHTSFTWEMMKLIRDDPTPRFDLVYIDGGHTWDTTGFAFHLADRLLVPGGWVVFDDLDWTLGGSASMRDKPWVKRLSPEERDTGQVRLVFRLLAEGGGYEECHEVRTWGFARKPVSPSGSAPGAMRGLVRRTVPVGVRRSVLRAARGARARNGSH